MPSGGKRPGSGRKKKAEKYESPIVAAEQKICDRLPEVVDALIECAIGIPLEREVVDGKLKVISRGAPDVGAGKYLVDRIMGKPKERVELDAKIDSKVDGNLTLDDLRNLPADELARRYRDAVNPRPEGGK